MTRRALRRGRRLPAETRRELLLEAAEAMLLDQGYLPLAVQDLASAARVSKALVYRYFPEPADLYNELLEREVEVLLAAGMEGAQEPDDLAEAYYRHVAARGPLIQIILRDRFMAGRTSRSVTAVRDRIALRLARRLRAAGAMTSREAVAAVGIGFTMPEECGRLAFQGDLDLERGAAMCRELTLGVVDVASRRRGETHG